MYKVAVLAVVFVASVSGQFGSRGVVSLPPGWVYHDNLTLDASRAAARFAIIQQHKESERKVLSLQGRFQTAGSGQDSVITPVYGQQTGGKVGREYQAQEVLAYGDALFFNPPEENRF